MSYRDLDYICCLAEQRSITKAAKVLNITQPALSIFLRNLEQRLDTRLFEHVGKSLVPTYAGERYLYYAREIRIMQKAMEEELVELKEEGTGCLSLTCMLPRSTYLVPETIPAFKQCYPNVTIQLYEEVSYSALERNILDGRAFLGVGNFFSKDSNITSVTLGEEEILLAVYADHPVVKRMHAKPGDPPRPIDLREFKYDPLIVPKNTRSAEVQQALFDKINPKPSIFLETRNIENALRLCSEGMGITFLCNSHSRFKFLPPNIVFFSTAEPEAKMELYLLHRTNAYIPAYVQYYIELLRKYAGGNL